MSRTKNEHPNPTSLHLYLRTYAGLTQAQLAADMGSSMNAIDISRIERGSPKMTLGKIITIARYWNISVDDLVRNNYAPVLPKLSPTPFRNPAVQERRRRRQLKKLDIGDAGEAFVAMRERQKLRGTPYEHGVNEAFADDPNAGFDVSSFTRRGEQTFIEVKTTSGDLDEPFFLTASERYFLLHCAEHGLHYELHRVYHMSSATKADIKIYSAQELLDFFDFEVCSYQVRRRTAA